MFARFIESESAKWGKLVSEAAQGATPAGFDNHGAYVKTIAQDNHGHATAAKHSAKP